MLSRDTRGRCAMLGMCRIVTPVTWVTTSSSGCFGGWRRRTQQRPRGWGVVWYRTADEAHNSAFSFPYRLPRAILFPCRGCYDLLGG